RSATGPFRPCHAAAGSAGLPEQGLCGADGDDGVGRGHEALAGKQECADRIGRLSRKTPWAIDKKRAPCGARVHKVEDSRRRLSLKGGKRRLRTCGVKSSYVTTSSKMKINFIVDMRWAHADNRPLG